MTERSQLEQQRREIRRQHGTLAANEPIAPAAAVFDAAAREQTPGRGGGPAVGRAIDGLHTSAGNAAVARLFEGATTHRHQEGQATARAGHAGTTDRPGHASSTDRPVVQASAAGEAAPADEMSNVSDATLVALAAGPPKHGPSWTHVGPPSNTTYAVSGTLRDAANTVAARTEAGSVTTTPSSDADVWTPDGGNPQVIGARVTVDQVEELPTWADESQATANQQAEWNRFHGAITTHEAGHVSIDKTSYANAHSKMVGKSPESADKALDTVEATATTDNATYDTKTDHGLNQGTRINPNIDEVTKVP